MKQSAGKEPVVGCLCHLRNRWLLLKGNRGWDSKVCVCVGSQEEAQLGWSRASGLHAPGCVKLTEGGSSFTERCLNWWVENSKWRLDEELGQSIKVEGTARCRRTGLSLVQCDQIRVRWYGREGHRGTQYPKLCMRNFAFYQRGKGSHLRTEWRQPWKKGLGVQTTWNRASLNTGQTLRSCFLFSSTFFCFLLKSEEELNRWGVESAFGIF